MKKKVFNKVMEFLPIALIIALLATLVYCIYYIGRLEDQIWERDKTIQDLSFRSDLVEEYFDIRYDSIEHTVSYSLKNAKRNNVVIYNDSTELKIYKGDESLTIDELVKDYNSLVKEYSKLVKECNKAYEEIYNNKVQIEEMQAALELVESRYNIQYIAKRDSANIMVTLTNTERLDSAMVLLPYYKYKVDKIEKHPNGYWVVHYYSDSLSASKKDNTMPR